MNLTFLAENSPLFRVFMAVSAACLGACIGSFLNVCIYRIPLDESVVTPRSHCMSCGLLIPWYYNIPVVSYFVLRGRCAKCGSEFSFRYTFVELMTAMFFVCILCMWVSFSGGHPPFMFRTINDISVVPVLWLFVCGTIVATFVDFDHFIIPDSVSIGGAIAGVALSFLVPEMHGEVLHLKGLAAGFLGAVSGSVPLQILRVGATWIYRRNGRLGPDEYAMGLGDIKYIAAIGAFLGWEGAFFSIAGAAFLGSAAALPLLAVGKKKLLDRMPFGPYMSAAALVWMLWGERIASFYAARVFGI